MINTEEFKKENDDILELQAVLGALVQNEDLHCNGIFCELLERYKSSIQNHLDHEDRSIYSELLNHNDKQVNSIATQFIDNTHELRRLTNKFVKRWCGNSMSSDSHDTFIKEAREIFGLMNHRIDLENNRLFPVIANMH